MCTERRAGDALVDLVEVLWFEGGAYWTDEDEQAAVVLGRLVELGETHRPLTHP